MPWNGLCWIHLVQSMSRLWVLVDNVMSVYYLSKQLLFSQEGRCFVELISCYYIGSFSKASKLFKAKGRTHYSWPVRGPNVED